MYNTVYIFVCFTYVYLFFLYILRLFDEFNTNNSNNNICSASFQFKLANIDKSSNRNAKNTLLINNLFPFSLYFFQKLNKLISIVAQFCFVYFFYSEIYIFCFVLRALEIVQFQQIHLVCSMTLIKIVILECDELQ